MTKQETRLCNLIRDRLKRDYGIYLHKNWGGVFTETGAADLYGTLPGGRAVYFELKTPDGAKRKGGRAAYQKAWLAREEKMGALTGVVMTYADVRSRLHAAGIYPHRQMKKSDIKSIS